MKHKAPIEFMKYRYLAAGLSLLLVLGSIGSLAVRHLNLGLDFTGGTLIEVGYAQPVELNSVRATLSDAGYGDAVVQHFGSAGDVLVRLAPAEGTERAKLGDQVLSVLRAGSPVEVSLRRVEFVGPQVGEELRDQGGLGLLLALGMVMLYVAFRFQFKFSVGAVVALAHDVLITLGLFSVFQIQFDLTVLAALLAVIGYSLNDTIVVSDRIRENFRKIRRASPVEVVNISLTEVLARTIVTSLTTMLVLLALFFVGGELIHGFATALIIGVLVGTYSSIYVASNILLAMKISREDLLLPEKNDPELEARP